MYEVILGLYFSTPLLFSTLLFSNIKERRFLVHHCQKNRPMRI